MLLLAACAHAASVTPTRTASASPGGAAETIDFAGLPGVTFGATRTELLDQRLIEAGPVGCGGPQLTGRPYASAVFDRERLVLIWAYPPLRTPEGIGVGTPVDRARSAYPTAEELIPPPASPRYPGLLVTGGGDRAYLMLYASGQVQKLIVGFASAARELFGTGFGSC